ncbi:MAG: hypothetical protein J2P37_17720, partial [Ktedonobacteraceae bacterium]|nr:hypothetical protein [Ktedonobacteraceae bacterium]
MSEKSGIQRDDQHPAAEPPDGGPRILGLDQSSGGGAGKDATKEPGSEGARGETQAAAEQHPLVAQYQRDLEAANATKVERGVAAAQATSEGEIAIIVEGASAKKAEIDADISLGS